MIFVLGRTALHWSVAVDNFQISRTLILKGADREALDFNQETPLFVAAKEGCANSAQLLIDFCAKRDVADVFGRLPRDVAKEKLHHDIVNILDVYQQQLPFRFCGST